MEYHFLLKQKVKDVLLTNNINSFDIRLTFDTEKYIFLGGAELSNSKFSNSKYSNSEFSNYKFKNSKFSNFEVSDSKFQIPNVKPQILSSEFQFPNFKLQISISYF